MRTLFITAILLVGSLVAFANAETVDFREMQSPPAASAADQIVNGVRFNGWTSIGNESVPLRGAALATYFRMKIYVAALYVPEDAKSTEQILGDVPKRLVLHYLRNVKSKHIIQSSEKVVKKNPNNNVQALRSSLDQIYSWFQNVTAGDRYELLYEPGKGSTLLFNGRPAGTIEGQDFAAAFFGIWLSDYPIDKTLRQKLCK